MAIGENIQTMQGFLGYFNPAQAERMARGCRVRVRTGAEGSKPGNVSESRMDVAIAENIRTMQGFLGYFNPAEAEQMARGCRVQARGGVEGTERTDTAGAENIQTLQAFLGYFNPAQAEQMARGCRVRVRTGAEGSKPGNVSESRLDVAIAENIRTMQGFLGYFNPAEAEQMARGCRVQARGGVEGTKRTDTAGAENIQTLQAFLGYFNPAEAERMARGCRVRLAGDVTSTEEGRPALPPEQVADGWLVQALAALQDAFQDWEITIEEATVDEDNVAVRFAVPHRQLEGDWATMPAIAA